MSGNIFRKNINLYEEWSPNCSIFGKGNTAKLALLAVFFSALTTTASEGALFGNSRTTKSNKQQEKETIQVRIDNSQFQQRNITGSNLDSYQFAQTHFGQSKAKLEQICRAISSRYNDNSARDILQKVFVVDTQIYLNGIKNSALAVSEVLKANTATSQGLYDLRQIIMSPGSQTLETLDKSIDKIRSINATQLITSQKYLACLENIISMSQASYETYELIPSLNITELDLFVQASKQLMTNIRSHSESFKGLILNVKSSSEQIDSGLTSIKKTLKETLRFSDHFAIKQFPLINLPAPSREKIYVQINSLANTVKGVDNTISIADSQVRNSSQQFTHLVSAYVDKSAESLKYSKKDFSEKAQDQISSYARNQVCGLFARIKEDMSSMRSEMASASKATNLQPVVNMETRSEFVARKTKSVAETKLPLFLLGGKGNQTSNIARANTMPSALSTQTSDNTASFGSNNDYGMKDELFAIDNNNKKDSENYFKNKTNSYSNSFDVSDNLFADDDFASANENDSGFMTSEMNILQQELGNDFFFGDSGENISGDSLLAKSTDEDLPSYGVEDCADSDSQEMQVSYGNLENGDPEFEMMRFDSDSLASEDSDSLPMMKYDSDVLNFDELNEE